MGNTVSGSVIDVARVSPSVCHMHRVLLVAVLVGLAAGFAPATRSAGFAPATLRSPRAAIVTQIARGPKTGEESCAIRNAGMVPKISPVLFGGGRVMTEEETFKTWIGHIIPAVVAGAVLWPSLGPKLLGA